MDKSFNMNIKCFQLMMQILILLRQINKSMEALDIFLTLIGKTEGRDKFLRLIQYACLHSIQHNKKGAIFNIYKQMRITRKLLRFLRTLQYSTKIKQTVPELKKSMGTWSVSLKHLLSILQNLFTVLFYLSDHRVCLGELRIISKETADAHYPQSMKFYFLQNLFGALHNLISMALVISSQNSEVDDKQKLKLVRATSFDLLKCILDCLVGLYYWKGILPANRIGIVGMITSIMGIVQSIQKM